MANGRILQTVYAPYFGNSLTDHHQVWLGKKHCPIELYYAAYTLHFLFWLIKLQKNIKEIDTVSLCCKSHRLKIANIKILSADSKHRS